MDDSSTDVSNDSDSEEEIKQSSPSQTVGPYQPLTADVGQGTRDHHSRAGQTGFQGSKGSKVPRRREQYEYATSPKLLPKHTSHAGARPKLFQVPKQSKTLAAPSHEVSPNHQRSVQAIGSNRFAPQERPGPRRYGTNMSHQPFENDRSKHEHNGPRGPQKRPFTPSVIRYNKLKQWAEQENSSHLIIDISINLGGLSTLLQQRDIKQDWMAFLIKIFKSILNSQSQAGSKYYIFKSVCESRFFEIHVKGFLDSVGHSNDSPDLYGHFSNLIDIVEYIIRSLPEFKVKCYRLLEVILHTGRELNVLPDGHTLTARAENCLKLAEKKSLKRLQQIRNTKSDQSKIMPYPDEDLPPDNYKDIELFPDVDELDISVEPFLRANKTTGPYRDLSHYLDVHARLLKEDYLEPIRRGLQEYKGKYMNGKVRESDLRFYYDVQLVKMGYDSSEGITHYVTFKGFEDMDWEKSRRLLYGSLLCFSKDNFESVIFATVADKDQDNLARNLLQVIFQNHLEDVFISSEQDIYVIGETTAYFESYRHVLEGIQEMNELPLDRYILYCCKDVRPPSYIQPNQTFDVRCIFPDEEVDQEILVSPLQTDLLSFADASELNESQLQALQLAFTKELAIIQGPPGTGKTYVGLKIMDILLRSQGLDETLGREGPILVVCFTNHALDQFLEGILRFCPTGIVRVGGRSRSEKLSAFNLRELRNKALINPQTRGHIWRKLKFCSQQLRNRSKLIKSCRQELMRSETTILTMEDLKEEMSHAHASSLNNPKRLSGSSTHVLSQWLKAANANMDNHLKKAAKRHLAKLIASQTSDPANDSKLTSERMAVRTGILQRFKIYNGWLTKYKEAIRIELESLMHEENHSERFYKLVDLGAEASNDILPDEALQKYMTNDIVFEDIKACVKYESGVVDNEGTFVRQWMLGTLRETDQLLDAIESLTPVKTSDVADAPNEFKKSHTESRWEIGDSDDSDDDSPDDDLDDMGLDEIDDGGKIEMLDFKELEEGFEQAESKDMLLLERAKMLGIDLIEQFTEEEDEWKMTNTMSYGKVFHFLHSATDISEEEVSGISDVWNLKLPDRYRLYKYWVYLKKQKLVSHILSLTKEYNMLLQQKMEALDYKDVEILSRARVIGMTTTGAAKNRKVLQEVSCPIIVVEEAAEVLEAHIVTTLNKNCKHLILIGDHQQLRPKPTVHRLAVHYDLEISLFERLVKNRVPHVTLKEQHRMRPEISQFIQFIYRDLMDHESVLYYDSIEGMKSNVFFLHHAHEESEIEDSKSKANVHEAKFLTALCDYFLNHGYLGRQITILAAYGGQVQLIKDTIEETPDRFEGVNVTSVDNYQGEENDIILLSLVRSNTENEVGFLKVSNRVCVALSRAKKGLYAIGNFESLKTKSGLWRNILSKAEGQRMTGSVLPLVCVNHMEHITYVATSEDFKKEVPEGGCYRNCEFELPCGHLCTRMCHASDRYHVNAVCHQPCQRSCPSGHRCLMECSEECGDCEFRVEKTVRSCGHSDRVPCHMPEELIFCSQMCDLVLSCGHRCRGKCGQCLRDDTHFLCPEEVEKEWPCKHKSLAKCYIDVQEDPCPSRCGEKLQCGHRCTGTCGICLGGRVHKACGGDCKKLLPCGHPCKGSCGIKCPPCSLRCVNSCRHGGCGKTTCGELCEPCTDNCEMSCKHQQCHERCIDDCKKKTPCNELCKNLLPECNHRCASLCGEECVCLLCEKHNIRFLDASGARKPKYEVARDKQERAKKIDLSDDLVLMKIPRCKHVFTKKQLDRYVEKFDPSGTSFIRCPECPNTLHGVWRYDAHNKERTERRENLKSALIDSMKVSEEQLARLIKSKELIEDFCQVDDGEFLSRKQDQIDINHAYALTLQIRFAYILKQVTALHKDFNSAKTVHFGKWKAVIQAIRKKITDQLRKELELELWRVLLIEQLMALKMFEKEMEVSVPDKIKSETKSLINDFSKGRLSQEGKTKFQGTMKEMFSLLKSSPAYKNYKEYIQQLKDQVSSVERVLKSPDWEDLSTILKQAP